MRVDLALLVCSSALILAFSVREVRMWRFLQAQRSRTQKYKLYRIRDQLVYLVASGELRESDVVFQTFYKAVNFFIRETDSINFRNFVSAVQSARKKGIDPVESQRWESVEDELRKRPLVVNEAIREFCRTIAEILFENSRTLRFALWLKRIARFPVIEKLERRSEAYPYYHDYSTAAACAA